MAPDPNPSPPPSLTLSEPLITDKPSLPPSSSLQSQNGASQPDLAVLNTSSEAASSKPFENSKRLWLSLLKSLPPSAGANNLEFVDPVYKDGFLHIPEEVYEEGAKLWEDRVVGFFLDKKLPFNYVKTAITKRWNTLGDFDMALDGDLYYFKFISQEDRERVLDEGSFHLAGKLFIIKPWSRRVEQSRGMVKSVPIWVKMSKVPKDLWNSKGFGFLGSAIGKPLFTDKTTEKGNMLTYARVCIEIEPVKDLPTLIPLGPDKTIELEYPWKPLICPKCQAFGHSSAKCSPPLPQKSNLAWKAVAQKKQAVGSNMPLHLESTEILNAYSPSVPAPFTNNLAHSEPVATVCSPNKQQKKLQEENEWTQVISKGGKKPVSPPQTTSPLFGCVSSNSFRCLEAQELEVVFGEDVEKQREAELDGNEEGKIDNEVEKKADCCINGQDEALVSMENLEGANQKASNSVDVQRPHDLVVGDKENESSDLSSSRVIVLNETESESENPLGRQDYQNGEEIIHFQISEEVSDRLVTTVFGVKFGRSSSTCIKETLPKNDWRGRFIDDPNWGTMLRLLGDVRKEAAAAFYQAGLVSIDHIKIHRPEKSLKEKFHLAPWGAAKVKG